MLSNKNRELIGIHSKKTIVKKHFAMFFVLILACTLAFCGCTQNPDTSPADSGASASVEAAVPSPTMAAGQSAAPTDSGLGIVVETEKPADDVQLPSIMYPEPLIEVDRVVEPLLYDMWECYVTMEAFKIPYYVEENPNTYFAMRWPDYFQTVIAAHPERQLVSIDSIVITSSELITPSDYGYEYKGMAEIRYTRKDPSVNGVNVYFEIGFETTDKNEAIITSIHLIFNSDYSNMLEEANRRIAGGENPMKVIDSVVDIAIKYVN